MKYLCHCEYYTVNTYSMFEIGGEQVQGTPSGYAHDFITNLLLSLRMKKNKNRSTFGEVRI